MKSELKKYTICLEIGISSRIDHRRNCANSSVKDINKNELKLFKQMVPIRANAKFRNIRLMPQLGMLAHCFNSREIYFQCILEPNIEFKYLIYSTRKKFSTEFNFSNFFVGMKFCCFQKVENSIT
ncbi:hypothetical protein BpHYR1_037448 [Brachionus plicatilis]|uniref:Uncharacterized protein n=1 Tax=Brachionus plicatilis TaxID=10195 RepID=A0A3M7SF90_BRAPC|nr:hypothetical protein BpHYR1_037448 [Brachionus plicatilis]